jgi:hypothetical protein
MIDLSQAKKLFEQHFPEQAMYLKKNDYSMEHIYSALLWEGFSTALKATGQLQEE